MGIGAGGFVFLCLGGFIVGCLSGLTPGLHVNNLAFLLAGFAGAASEYVAPSGLGLVMVTAAVTHTFLDILPSIVLGVPDSSMALVALPGHRMVLEGDGREAVVLSAAGSMLAVVFSFFIAVPVTLLMVRAYPTLSEQMPVVLVGTVLFSIPFMGYVVSFGNTTTGYVTLVLVPVMLFIFNELWELWKAGTRSEESP